MTSLTFSLPQLQMVFFIFLRVCAILLTAPVFDSETIPILFKAGLAFAISLILFPILNLDTVPFQPDLLPFGIGVISEVLIGLIIGLCVKTLFAGVVLAGELAGYQMGLAMANVMDPTTSEQMPLLGHLNNLIAMLIFLATNAHHLFLRALVESFQIVPPFDFHFGSSVMDQTIGFAGDLFVVAIKLGAPLIAVLLLMSVAFGLAARTVPQMNIFFVAAPLKIIVGFLFMAFALPYMSSFLVAVMGGLGHRILGLLRVM